LATHFAAPLGAAKQALIVTVKRIRRKKQWSW